MSEIPETAVAHLNNALTLLRLARPTSVTEARETYVAVERRILAAIAALAPAPQNAAISTNDMLNLAAGRLPRRCAF